MKGLAWILTAFAEILCRCLEAGIQQIKDRQYMQGLSGYRGEMLLVGINYEKNNVDKEHSCLIEKIQMGNGTVDSFL